MPAYVEILHADGTAERHTLDGDLVVGRQPRSGVAIPYASELEAEHVLLSPRDEGCWLGPAEWARTPVVVNGQRFSGGLVPWGTDVNIGSVWLRVGWDREALATAAAAPEGDKSSVSTPTLLLSIAMVGAAGWLFLSEGDPGLPGMTTAQPPTLFSEAPSCPEESPSAALPRAREAADAAFAKSERYPFAAQDGIDAVNLYALAGSCFDAAGRDADAERMRTQRSTLEARIEEDYRTHRLKLERALQYRRTRQALIETRELLALVRHLDDPYTTWLSTMERHLLLKTGN